MNKEKVVLVVDVEGWGGTSYYRPFTEFGPCSTDLESMRDHTDLVQLVVFTGGQDVSPGYYGEKPHHTTCSSIRRDIREKIVFEWALEHKLPIAGICRGAQFLCAMAGGKLVQNITGHGRNHALKTNTGRMLNVSSTHHQMQLPPTSAIVAAWADPSLSDRYEGDISSWDGIMRPDREYDCVFYPNINAVGMQYHPEFMDEDSDGFKFCGELVRSYLLKG